MNRLSLSMPYKFSISYSNSKRNKRVGSGLERGISTVLVLATYSISSMGGKSSCNSPVLVTIATCQSSLMAVPSKFKLRNHLEWYVHGLVVSGTNSVTPFVFLTKCIGYSRLV